MWIRSIWVTGVYMIMLAEIRLNKNKQMRSLKKTQIYLNVSYKEGHNISSLVGKDFEISKEDDLVVLSVDCSKIARSKTRSNFMLDMQYLENNFEDLSFVQFRDKYAIENLRRYIQKPIEILFRIKGNKNHEKKLYLTFLERNSINLKITTSNLK